MSNDVVKYESGGVVVTKEEWEVLKTTLCKEATDTEMRLFFHDCARRGTHPLDRKIHFTKRKGRYVPITSIDFMRERAGATGAHLGTSNGVFTGTPGKPGFECKVTVSKNVSGKKVDFEATCRWEEYYPGSDGYTGMWDKMKHNQLEKCTEAKAFRKAFAAELANLYTFEEKHLIEEAQDMRDSVIEPYGDYKPDTWIEGTFLSIEPPISAEPGKFRVQCLDFLSSWDMWGPPLGWDEGYQEGDAIRFQYTKRGKYRVVTCIERFVDEIKKQIIEDLHDEFSSNEPVPIEPTGEAVEMFSEVKALERFLDGSTEGKRRFKNVKKDFGVVDFLEVQPENHMLYHDALLHQKEEMLEKQAAAL